ncbi:4Fe-4S binding protein [Sporomusa ovata]|uniref:4Fe-4S ferredoxin-type domain-containing protein n=1 Tax=Sporomusa ovata TaxID=2378 RepID=A0A0U1KXN9_9FIRM|nr:hypothetical protein SpAn4DRAFT_5069 [Sporomusa ovata]
MKLFKKKYIIKKDVCRQCNICPVECISGAIKKQPKELPVIDQARCVACGRCLSQCPFRAIRECLRINF